MLFTPFGVSADYAAGEFRLSARVMCADIQLFPRPARKTGKSKKPAKPKRKKKDEAAKAAKPQKDKPPLVTKEMLPELLRLLTRTLSRFRRKLTVNRFLLHITFAAADPYDAVMAYGAANMALAAAGGAASRAFNVRSSDVETGVDFSSEKPTLEAGLTVTISLARIIAVAAAAGAGFLKIKRRAVKAAKAAAKERKETDGTDADPDGRVS